MYWRKFRKWLPCIRGSSYPSQTNKWKKWCMWNLKEFNPLWYQENCHKNNTGEETAIFLLGRKGQCFLLHQSLASSSMFGFWVHEHFQPRIQNTLSSTCALQCPQCDTTSADRRCFSVSAAACSLHTTQPELPGRCRLTHGCNCSHTRGFPGLAASPTVCNLFFSSTSAQILGLC